jgi:hypothetical protein
MSQRRSERERRLTEWKQNRKNAKGPPTKRVLGSKKSRRASGLSLLEYQLLEHRQVLTGSAATDVLPATMFGLPTEVGAPLVKALANSQSISEGAWRPDTDNTFNTVEAWNTSADLNPATPWHSYVVPTNQPTGTTTISTLKTAPLKGGGNAVFFRVQTSNRSVSTHYGSGSSAMGLEGGPTWSGKSENVATNISTYIVHVNDLAQAEAIVANGSFNPSNYPSFFHVSVTSNFEFKELEPASGQLRKYSVTSSYLYDTAVVWGATSVIPEGSTTTTYDHDIVLMSHAEGSHLYQAFLSTMTNGSVVETYTSHGSGLSTYMEYMGSIITSTNVEGDLTGTGFGTNSTGVLTNDSLTNRSGVFNYDGNGSTLTVNGNSASSLARLESSNYTAQVSQDLDVTYSTRKDLSSNLTSDPNSTAAGAIYSGAAEGAAIESLISSGSGIISSKSRLNANGLLNTLLTKNSFYAGNTVETLGGAGTSFADTTGSSASGAGNYLIVGSAPSRKMTRSGNYSSSIGTDSISTVTTQIGLQLDKLNANDTEGQLGGSIVSQGVSPLLKITTALSSSYDDRDAWGRITPSTDTSLAAPAALTAGVLGYLESYNPGGLAMAPNQTLLTGNAAGAETGKDFGWIWNAGKFNSSSLDQNSGDHTFTTTLNFAPGQKPIVGTQDNANMQFFKNHTYSGSDDRLFSTGNFAGQNGAVSLTQLDNRGSGSSHGFYGGSSNLTMQEKDQPPPPPPTNSTGGGTSTTTPAPPMIDLYNMNGTSSSHFDETFDSGIDVSTLSASALGDFTDDIDNFTRFANSKTFAETTNLTSGITSSSITNAFATDAHKNTTSNSGGFASIINGSGSGYDYFHTKKHAVAPTGSGSGSGSGGPTTSTGSGNALGNFEYEFTSSPAFLSTGGNTANWSGTLKNGIRNVSNPNAITFLESTDGPVYRKSNGSKELSHAGSSSSESGGNYSFTTTRPSFDLKLFNDATGLEDGGVPGKKFEEKYKLTPIGDIVDKVEFSDDTEFSINVESDGIALVTDGSSSVKSTSFSRMTNSEPYVHIVPYTQPGVNRTVTTEIAVNKLTLDQRSIDTSTNDYDGFGVKLTYEPAETTGDVLIATMLGFSMKAKNVGAVTSTDESEGKSLISSEGTVTDERLFDDNKQFYFHEHRPTAKTGSEWNLKDELKREYLTSGDQVVTFTPSGWKTNAQKLDTEGEYVWRQETIDPSGPYAGAPVRNWGTSNYNSNGFATKTSMPSGSMSATFDEDGKVLSASGSVTHQDFFSGRAFSHLDGIGHGAKGGEGAAVLVAKRDVSRDRLGTFQGSVTTSISPVVNTNSTTGETTLAFDDGDPVITGTKYGYQNETDNRTVYQIFHGSVSASGNSFLVTDSGDLPEGESSSTNMLLPETDFGVDSSYGNPIAGLAPWEGFDAPFTSSGTWPGGANGSGGGGSSGGGSNGPQPGDSPLTLGTGNQIDLGLFSSAYGYKGETVGASFAWQLPNTGTPTDPTNFGDAVFNSGNLLNNGGTNETDGQSVQLSPGDLIKEILVAKYGMNDPYVWAFLYSGGRIEVFDFWFFSGNTDFYEDSDAEFAPVFQLDDNLAVNPFAAADIVYQMLQDHEDASFGKFVHNNDLVAQAKRRTGLAAARAADRSEEVFRMAMSACDAADFVMAMHDLTDKKIPTQQKLLIAALVAIPFVSSKFGRVDSFFDSSGNVLEGRLTGAKDFFHSGMRTGAYSPGLDNLGRGLGKLAGVQITPTSAGLKLIREHLSKMDPSVANQVMLTRIEDAIAKARPLEGADAVFYSHELYEQAIMNEMAKNGSAFMDNYAFTHKKALDTYGNSPFSVYHPEAILADEFLRTNPNWLRFWGIIK